MMQGQIEVDSEYGMGSTFTIQLMQKAVGKEKIRSFKPDELNDIYRGFSGPRDFTAPDARLLVVDDTPLNHTVIKELVKKCGMQIDTALSGDEALKMAGGKYYDLIFMDQRMPGLSGAETLAELRKKEGAVSRRVPVISMTANSYPGIKEAERSAGFEDYLEKPIESNKLMELLIQYLPESKIFYT
ncbi:MAG: response regulator [Lachnospiraceae bacterium]|nr:response regulator [Lachnospiraceae bacterium]